MAEISSRPITVLVTEDEPLTCLLMVDRLTSAGFIVLDVSSGHEAIKALKMFEVDVLITDLKLPGKIDGHKVAKAFQQRYPGKPVIYVSGYPREIQSRVPNSVVISKPCRPTDLISAVHRLALH